MRKVVIGVAAAAALAWTQAAQADHHTPEAQKKAEQKKADQMKPGASGGTGSGSQSGMSDTAPGARSPGTDSATASQEARTDASGREAKGHPLFEGKKNFDVDGKLSKASADELTIERKDGLPPATLKVGSGTKIELDGKRSSAAQLQPGQDVKVSFNLRGSTAEAVEVKAKKAEGNERKELQEQRRQNQQERAKDQQQQR